MPPEPRRGGAPAQGAVAQRITLVAAVARNRVIGQGNRLPWHLPADLAHFKRLTLDKPIVMGRRTWESLPGLLPRRRHIVISSNADYRAEGGEVVASPAAALAAAGPVPEVMVVGGAAVYAALLPQATHMALTLVDAELPGDVHFPAWPPSHWQEIAREHQPADARNAYAMDFIQLERRGAD